MKTMIIVQARMTSTRLPGKVLREVLGKTLLEYLIERLRRVTLADGFIIATTTNESDQPIVDLCKRLSVLVTRGSEHDVLSRYYEAATLYRADAVVRVTSDCPIIDPVIITGLIQYYSENVERCDYVSSGLQPSYPNGMDAEVFSYKALREAFLEAVDEPEREHVTPFIYRRPGRYRLANLPFRENKSQHRWTVDTSEDFELIRRIIEALYPVNQAFAIDDILTLLDSHPDWVQINAHVRQKTLGE